jgi:hypothetical protein
LRNRFAEMEGLNEVKSAIFSGEGTNGV